MSDIEFSILLSIASAILGVILGLLIDNFRDRLKFRQELKDNNYIDVSGGDWFAAWQTSVENTQNINTEHLSMEQKGQTVKIKNLEKAPENPKGGYLWEAQLQFFHGKALMGWYFPKREENITSKGILYLTYQSTKKQFLGRWVGAAYDGDLSNGFVVISKDRKNSLKVLTELIGKHPDTINIVYETF